MTQTIPAPPRSADGSSIDLDQIGLRASPPPATVQKNLGLLADLPGHG